MRESNSRRICYTCGKKYRYCSHCPEFRNMPDWMNITCCEQCHDLYVVCANFNLGKYSKEEAQALLSKYDLSQVCISRPNMVRTLQKIYEQDEDSATPTTIELSVVEEEVPESNNEEEIGEAVVEAVVEVKQSKPRRRKKMQVAADEADKLDE